MSLSDYELVSEAPFVRRRQRAHPLWTGFKFVIGVGLGFAVGCALAALLAPSAGEDTRQAIQERVRRRRWDLPDEAATRSGAVTRGLAAADQSASAGGVGDRIAAARQAMDIERRAHETALFARFRRALATGRGADE